MDDQVLVAGRYRLVNRLGAGGMGSVWEAWDERLRRPVALKMLHPHPGMSAAEAQVASDRATREARITARLHHPHAVPVFDIVEHEGQPCLIMQYLPSDSLHEILAQKGSLPPAEVARIGSQVASALATAHEAGIVHRDVKPANILITRDGSAKITDFGISHAMGDATLTSAGMLTGTPAYLAPEVARGEASSFASDVFSLGATLYTALEGQPPFGRHENPMALLHEVASGQIRPPSSGGPLTHLVLEMLAATPEDRPAMADLPEALDRLASPAGAGPTAAAPTPVTAPAPVPVPAPQPPAATKVFPAAGSPRPAAGSPSPPGATSRPAPAPRNEPADRRPRRGALVLLGVAAVVVLAAVWALQGLGGDDPKTPSAGPSRPVATSSSPAPTTTTTKAKPSPTKTAKPSPTPPRPTTTPPRPTTTPGGAPSAAQLTRALRDYYALMPNSTDEGWTRLTSRYQSTTASGRDSYESFWGSVQSVTVTDATGTPPGTVVAELTYVFDDGRVVDERTSYVLVRDGGILKIDRSTVLSSRQR